MNPRIAHLALACGLAALVPIPLLDGWVERRATRAMVRRVLLDGGHPADDATLDVLTNDRSSMLGGCLALAVYWPLKKLFRTVLYFLTIKDVLDGVTRAALRVAMVQAALPLVAADAEGVRTETEATLGRWHYSPISRVVLPGARSDASWVAANGRIGRLVGWLYRRGGGGALLADFEQRLAARRAAAATPSEPEPVR
jgi:hypothetical protein